MTAVQQCHDITMKRCDGMIMAFEYGCLWCLSLWERQTGALAFVNGTLGGKN